MAKLLYMKLFCLTLIRSIYYSEGSIQDQYVGCYHDAVSQSNWTTGSTGSSNLTIEFCIETCGILDTTYAILQGGNNCFCGDEFDASQPNNVCNTPCSGNLFEFCGGSLETKFYYIFYAVCPVGFYGNGCDEPCHCMNQIPCDRLTGICPNGCDGNWTQANCSTEATYLTRYIGCYIDSSPKASPKRVGDVLDPNTPQNCSNECALQNFTYAGLQWSHQCFCGEQYNRHGKGNESDCNTACNNYRQEICGGYHRNSVYSVCPTGSFGPSCTSQCHCNVSEICPYSNGTCKSGCKPGWSGIGCNVRECSIANGDCAENETCTTINLNYATVTRCQCSQGYYKARLWDTCIQLDSNTTTLSPPGTVSIIISSISSTTQIMTQTTEQQGYSLEVVIAVAIGSASASAVIILLIFAGKKCVRKGQRQGRQAGENVAMNNFEMSGDPSLDRSNEPNVYSNLEERTSQNDHLYVNARLLNGRAIARV